MKISEIADTIEYLELKTPHDIVISRILNIVCGDNFWLIHTRQGIYKFTRTGEFVKQIGRQGQGPDEYLYILGIDISPTRKEIIHADTQQILYYDYDGNFLRKEKINDYFFNIVFVDSVLWTCNLCMHIDKYMACALSLAGDTVTVMPNPNYGIESLNEGFSFVSSSELREFSKYKENVYMKIVKAGTAQRVLEIDTEVLYQWKDLVPTYEERITRIDGIYMDKVTCESADAIYELKGNSKLPAKNVMIRDVKVGEVKECVKKVNNVENVVEKNVTYDRKGK